MSKQYPGGIISKTAPTPSGSFENSTAPGVWTLEQQAYWQKLGQWPTAGNVDPSAFIENLFSTYLYSGTGVAQTITNGIDVSTKGGLVWIKGRNAAEPFVVVDTARGASNALRTSSTAAEVNDANRVSAFTTSGFSIGTDGETNGTTKTYVSWTFRKQPKFFDVVTYSGNSTAGREIPHSLGSAPGMIIVKSTSGSGSWWVFHRSLGATQRIALEDTAAAATNINPWYNTTPTSTVFTLSAGGAGNDTGTDYVAYLFAHDAGGFGLTGTDNVISCGSFTTDGSGNATVSLGYEPQWFMYKSVGVGNWTMEDVMRGSSMSTYAVLTANTSDAESAGTGIGSYPQATGVRFATGAASTTYIYITIRRGPMKVPTSGTSVFAPISATPTSGPKTTFTTNFPTDLIIERNISNSDSPYFVDRLRGGQRLLNSSAANAESSSSPSFAAKFDSNTNVISQIYNTGYGNIIGWNFQRAPSFFDEVCYTGNGVAGLNVTHNLGAVPELMIVKCRSDNTYWYVYSATLGATKNLYLNDTSGQAVDNTAWNDTAPTSTQFTLGNGSATNNNTDTYVNYLFATCAGVSKVGSYTGTATTQTINCGFTGGARFVLIKRTDSTGDWYVWDSARGIVAGNDPYLLLNSTAAEVTNTDYIDTYSAGFEISSTAPAAINANGGTFIFLAIA